MTFVLHAPQGDVELGPTLQVLTAFGRIARVAEGKDAGFAALYGVPHSNEEEVEQPYIDKVARQADVFLRRYGADLHPFEHSLLVALSALQGGGEQAVANGKGPNGNGKGRPPDRLRHEGGTNGRPRKDYSVSEAYVPLRFAKGTVKGGEFAPKRGHAALSRVKRALLHELVPGLPLPPSRRGGQGRRVRLHGRDVFVPQARQFERSFGAHTYVSPAGSTLIYKDGKLHEPGVEEKANLTVRMRPPVGGRDLGERLDSQIADALVVRSEDHPPVSVNAHGASADEALRENGFLEIASSGGPGRMVVDYVAPDRVSQLRLTFDTHSGRVSDVSWLPRRPVKAPDRLDAPPAGFAEFADDLEGYAHEIAAQHQRAPHFRRVLIDDDLADHAGEHRWNGDLVLAREAADDVQRAADARAQGRPLTDSELRGAYAAYTSAHHEALHSLNPLGLHMSHSDFHVALDEAVVEELSHLEAAKTLVRQGQQDVLDWAADHPNAPHRIGTYSAARTGLDRILNRAAIAPSEREGYLRMLLAAWTADRPNLLQDALEAQGLSADEAGRFVVESLLQQTPPSRFTPLLTAQIAPTSSHRPPFEVGGRSLRVGDPVIARRKRREGGHVVSEDAAGQVVDLHENEYGWTAHLAYEDGSHDYAVAPSELVRVQHSGHMMRVWGSRADSIDVGGERVREGDLVGYQGREARVERILNGGEDWAVEVTDEGHRLLLTPGRAPDLEKLADGGESAGLPAAHALTRLEDRVRANRHFDLPPGTSLLPTDRLLRTRAVDQDEQRHALDVLADPTPVAKLPPLTVQPRPDGRYDVLDGSDTLEPARTALHRRLPARLREPAPMPIEPWLAALDTWRGNLARQAARDEHTNGQLKALADAHRIVAAGGGQPELQDAARQHGPLDGSGGAINEGYQVGMRSAYLDLGLAQREHSLSLYRAAREPDDWRTPLAHPTLGSRDAEQIAQHFREAGQRHLADEWARAALTRRRGAQSPGLFDKESFFSKFSFGHGKPGKAQPAVKKGPKVDVSKLQGGEIVADLNGKTWQVHLTGTNDVPTFTLTTLDGAEHEYPEDELPYLTFVRGPTAATGGSWAQQVPKGPPPVTWDDKQTVKLVKPAGGSNGAMFAEDKTGQRWLVKSYKGDQDRVATELLANAVYQRLGVPVAEMGTLEFGGKPAIAYPLVDGETDRWRQPNAALADGFMADALLANWDVVGLGQDNILWAQTPDGQWKLDATGARVPVRIDQGGTLQYRAQGQQKPFGPIPSEVWTMATPGKGQAFGTMALTAEGKRAGAAEIAQTLTPHVIDQLVDAAPFQNERMRDQVRDALKARVAWMGDYADGKIDEPRPVEGSAARTMLSGAQARTNLDPEQAAAVNAATVGWLHPLNEYLRYPKAPGAKLPEEAYAMQKTLDGILAKHPLPGDVRGYMVAPKSALAEDAVGGTLNDRGFASLSLGREAAVQQAGGGAILRVHVPEGAKAILLHGFPGMDTDQAAQPELLLARDARLKIVGRSVEGGVTVLDAAVV